MLPTRRCCALYSPHAAHWAVTVAATLCAMLHHPAGVGRSKGSHMNALLWSTYFMVTGELWSLHGDHHSVPFTMVPTLPYYTPFHILYSPLPTRPRCEE